MTTAPRPLTGRCMCGSATYTIDADPVVQGICHCTDCQRQSGSAFSVNVGVPSGAVHAAGATLATYETNAEHGGTTVRNFCSGCGSPLFSVSPEYPDLAWIKVGSMDDASWVMPMAEVWTRSAQPWAPHVEGIPQLERGAR